MSESQQVTCARIALRLHGGPMQDEDNCSCEHCVALRELIALLEPREPWTTFASAAEYEAKRAEGKWPDNEIFHRLAALSGEVGELAEGVIKQRPKRELAIEAIQVAACAFRAYKALG